MSAKSFADKLVRDQQEENEMGTDIIGRIQNDFTYHTPPAEVRPIFVEIREKAKELAILIANKTPFGREQATALTRLEETVMHANAGLARQYPAQK